MIDSIGQAPIKGFYKPDFNNMTSWEFLVPKWTKKQKKKTEREEKSRGE